VVTSWVAVNGMSGKLDWPTYRITLALMTNKHNNSNQQQLQQLTRSLMRLLTV